MTSSFTPQTSKECATKNSKQDSECHTPKDADPRVREPKTSNWPDGAFVFHHGETDMGDKGSKDKGKREHQKKAQLTQKEKRKLKKQKKKK